MDILVDQISLKYGDHLAVDNLTFKLRKGEVHGLLGPNGSGKTTTIKMLCGLLRPNKGEILFDGKKREALPGLKSRIGFLTETLPLYYDLTVEEYLKYVGMLKDIPAKDLLTHMQEIVERLGLESVWTRKIAHLSRGYRQRCAIAQALIGNPELVVLDEPTLGLDPKSIAEIRGLIKWLKSRCSVLISSHLLHEVGLVCDRVTIIDKGRLVLSDELETLKQDYVPNDVIIFNAESKGFNKELVEQQIPGLSFMELSHQNAEIQAKVVVRGAEDPRKSLIAFFGENNMNLLEIRKEQFELEHLFLHLTRGEQDRV